MGVLLDTGRNKLWRRIAEDAFPFSMGMLLSRDFKPIKVKGAFWICAIALVALFSVPCLEGATGIYKWHL